MSNVKAWLHSRGPSTLCVSYTLAGLDEWYKIIWKYPQFFFSFLFPSYNLLSSRCVPVNSWCPGWINDLNWWFAVSARLFGGSSITKVEKLKTLMCYFKSCTEDSECSFVHCCCNSFVFAPQHSSRCHTAMFLLLNDDFIYVCSSHWTCDIHSKTVGQAFQLEKVITATILSLLATPMFFLFFFQSSSNSESCFVLTQLTDEADEAPHHLRGHHRGRRSRDASGGSPKGGDLHLWKLLDHFSVRGAACPQTMSPVKCRQSAIAISSCFNLMEWTA